MSTNRKTCFVIMPFSKTTHNHTEEYWTRHYQDFLKPLIEENPEVEARRSQPLHGDILNQIIADLIDCPVVVADLTDENPNVFWELGVRQSFKSGTITIAQIGTKLPFDISTKGTLFYYPNDHLKSVEFRRSLNDAIRDCLEHPKTDDSRILELIGGRGTLFEITRKDDTIRRLDALISEVKHNIISLDRLTSNAESDEDPQNQHSFAGLQFCTAALELLVTERYIEETEVFFVAQEIQLSVLSKMNLALSRFVSDNGVDTMMLAVHQIKTGLEDTLERLIQNREKLKSKI